MKAVGNMVILAAITIFWIGCGSSSEPPEGNQSQSVSATTIAQPTERFVLSDLEGRQRRWSEFLGRPFIVNFWASWCGPCRHEMPLLKEIYEKYHPQGLEIIGISVDQQRQAVAPFVRQFGIPYVIVFADDQVIEELRLGRGIPVTIFFDAQGNETGRISGAQAPELFYRELDKIFGK